MPTASSKRSAKTVKGQKTAYSRLSAYSKPSVAAFGLEEETIAPPVKGQTYGRCGGRPLKSPLEQRLCQRLSEAGVAHSHAPRRYEVEIADGRLAAYAPGIVLRGRGREGKTSIIDPVAVWNETTIQKINAFRRHYSSEFYTILVAPSDIMSQVPESSYDESLLPGEIDALAARLSE